MTRKEEEEITIEALCLEEAGLTDVQTSIVMAEYQKEFKIPFTVNVAGAGGTQILDFEKPLPTLPEKLKMIIWMDDNLNVDYA